MFGGVLVKKFYFDTSVKIKLNLIISYYNISSLVLRYLKKKKVELNRHFFVNQDADKEDDNEDDDDDSDDEDGGNFFNELYTVQVQQK